ncbi:uncharacterized protein MONOS_2260 [Monocercomonoides exilis]|uniref:uncharacterized protein n=1 Tax=Monocercomonoides exilis TaxID=2049356 RepID=UPI00355996FB|nr:hypothetical protein MONOS_2260 [Monocercomonoides exilis]|eukprot:MONOS_2260.1-p1 / transcript=MONOS_2260.1 / gene=MONOS_2260 / organism=Monocercomonoides_exilis_PA203 / gene_product=unspecified product / transcript_product=unspecified product / location=Mono_scaffold00045:136789-138757(+) / protein_length=635 / sequence_SO=supercontig / SO=protein_coding / is_pseudo=false
MIEAHLPASVVDVHRHNTENAILWKELSLNQLSYAFTSGLTPPTRHLTVTIACSSWRLQRHRGICVCTEQCENIQLIDEYNFSNFNVRAEHWVEERDLRKGMMHQMGGMGLGGNGGGGEGGKNDDDNNGGDGSGGKQGGANGVGMSAISIEPREGHLETGEECVVRFSCNHHSEGMHQTSFIWQLLGGGKQVVLEIACQTLSPIDEHVVFESGRGAEATAMHFLEQVPIGEMDAQMQSIVLRNEGWTSIDYRLDLSDVERLNASASDFPLFECPVTRGIVPAYGKQTIYWRFRPLMQRGYLVRIPIKLGSRYSSMSVMNANVGGGAGGGDGNVNGTNHSPSSNNGIGMGVGGAQGGAQGAAGGGSDGTEGITHTETVLQALLTGDGFIAKEGAEPLVDEKKTTIPAPLSPLPGQLCLLSHERIGFGSVAGGSIERRLVCLVCPRVRRHPALQKRAYEKGEKRGILFDWEESHPLIKSQVVTIRPIRGEIAEGERCVCVVELHAPIAAQVVDTSLQCNIRKAIFTSSISNSSIANQNSSSSSSINGVGASSEVNQIFSYHRFPSARRSSSVNGTSSSSSSVVASNFNSGSIDDHSTVASLSTQHSQLGKIKGLPSSSYPVPSQSSSSSSLAIAPH